MKAAGAGRLSMGVAAIFSSRSEPIPLHTDAEGVIRVGSTRVSLETVVGAFQSGDTPEQIVDQFPVLALDDVYAIITYYLRNRAEVEDYLARSLHESESVHLKIKQNFNAQAVRERLLARQRASD